MTVSNDASFYVERERQERELAERACDPAIAAIHAEMADRYARLTSVVPGVVIRPQLRASFGRA